LQQLRKLQLFEHCLIFLTHLKPLSATAANNESDNVTKVIYQLLLTKIELHSAVNHRDL